MTLAADDLLAALRALADAPSSAPDERVALLAAEGARVLAAANLVKSMSTRLAAPDLSAADAAQGAELLAAQLRRQAEHVGEGRGPEHPLGPQLEGLRAAWRALADAAGALRDASSVERRQALMHAELSWRRAHAEVRRGQQGPHGGPHR